MKFKEMLDEDLDIFFNPEEIGENVTFEGKNIVVIKSSEEFSRKNDRYGNAGIYNKGLSLSMLKKDLPYEIYINSMVNLNNTSYEVIDIEELGNTIKLSLISNYK